MRESFYALAERADAMATAEWRAHLDHLAMIDGPLPEGDPRRQVFAFARWVTAFAEALPVEARGMLGRYVLERGASYIGACVTYAVMGAALPDDASAELDPRDDGWWEVLS